MPYRFSTHGQESWQVTNLPGAVLNLALALLRRSERGYRRLRLSAFRAAPAANCGDTSLQSRLMPLDWTGRSILDSRANSCRHKSRFKATSIQWRSWSAGKHSIALSIAYWKASRLD